MHAAILGCGVAICALAFAVGDGVVLHRLPFPEPLHLVWIGADPAPNSAALSQSQYDVLERRLHEVLSVAPYLRAPATLRTGDETERVSAAVVGGEFFTVLGTRPLLGRFVNEEDDHEGAEPTVVLSEDLWRRVFRADPTLPGTLVLLDDRPHRVVGILKSGTGFPLAGTDLWIALGPTKGPMLRTTDAPFLSAVGRVRDPAMAPEAAFARIREELRRLPPARVAVADASPRYLTEPLHEHLVGPTRPAVVVLAAAAGFLMLIACLAAATIQLARYAAQERDVAIRTIVGATPLRLGRDVVKEAVLTAALAAAIGLVLSKGGLYIGQRLGEAAIPELSAVHINARVFVFATLIAAVCGLAVTTIPLFALLRSSTAQMLQRTSHTASVSKTGAQLRDGLIGVAVGVTLVLVLASVVAAHTLVRLIRVEMGFFTKDVVSASVRLPFPQVTPAEAGKIRAFVQSLETEIHARKPATAFAVSTDMPGKGTQSIVTVQYAAAPQGPQPLRSAMSQVSGEYFAVLRIPVIRGRVFSTMDNAQSRSVVIIDIELARRVFGSDDPLGRSLMINDLGVAAEVIGVVGTVRQSGRLTEGLPQIYLPFDQLPLSTMAVLLRDGGAASAIASDVRAAVRASGPSAAVTGIMPLEQQLYDEVRRPQFYALVLAMLALLAMVVSAAAVHASVAALVAQRAHEIGIRMALGATRARIIVFVLSRVAQMMALGSVAGFIAALVLWQGLVRRGFAIGQPTPAALLSTLVILWLAGGAAVVLPVLRATRIRPLVALTE